MTTLNKNTKIKKADIRRTKSLGPSVIGMEQVNKLSQIPNPLPPVEMSKTINNGYASIISSETKIKKTIILNKNIFFIF